MSNSDICLLILGTAVYFMRKTAVHTVLECIGMSESNENLGWSLFYFSFNADKWNLT